jgi:mRNA interferase MazF
MLPFAEPVHGEIWIAKLDTTVGAEIAKTRPVVIISLPGTGHLPLRLAVPITDWKPYYERYGWFTKLEPSASNGLSKMSGADAFQCKSLSVERFTRKLGSLPKDELKRIVLGILFCTKFFS